MLLANHSTQCSKKSVCSMFKVMWNFSFADKPCRTTKKTAIQLTVLITTLKSKFKMDPLQLN